jgi:hypothetical protein
MTPLGKPLVFYLKYVAEMNRLYGDPEYYGGEPDLTGLDDAGQVRDMARIVGDTASEQVADFLELCGRGIEKHFTSLGIARLAGKKTRAFIKNHWAWSTELQVPSVATGEFWCGVWITAPPEVRISLANDACGVVVPWLWSMGGRKGEDAIWEVVGSWADSRAGEGLVSDSGTVALARIPVTPQPSKSFDVDRDQLIAAVMETVARIRAKQMKAIARLVAGLKETDEN